VYRSKITQGLVIVAGVVMNVLFAFLLFVVGFMMGMPTGIDPEEAHLHPNAKLVVSNVLPGSPAEIAGILSGDQIVKVYRQSTEATALDPIAVSSFIASEPGPIYIDVIREERTKSFIAEPAAGLLGSEPDRRILGFGLGLVDTVSFGFFEAISHAFIVTGAMLAQISVALVQFVAAAFTLTADFSQVAGPVGIVGLVGDASAVGISALISFTALISLNLAVVNMLPFPALDGGRFVMILVEKVKGSRIHPQFANALNGIGFILLLALMAAVTASDIFKLL
jgi:regulator of sigma E protease